MLADSRDLSACTAVFFRALFKSITEPWPKARLVMETLFYLKETTLDNFTLQSDMKETIMEKTEKYVMRENRARVLLQQLREAGRQTFLLTNSDYRYTDVRRFSICLYRWEKWTPAKLAGIRSVQPLGDVQAQSDQVSDDWIKWVSLH